MVRLVLALFGMKRSLTGQNYKGAVVPIEQSIQELGWKIAVCRSLETPVKFFAPPFRIKVLLVANLCLLPAIRNEIAFTERF